MVYNQLNLLSLYKICSFLWNWVVYISQLMVYNNQFMVVDEGETQIGGAKLRA